MWVGSVQGKGDRNTSTRGVGINHIVKAVALAGVNEFAVTMVQVHCHQGLYGPSPQMHRAPGSRGSASHAADSAIALDKRMKTRRWLLFHKYAGT